MTDRENMLHNLFIQANLNTLLYVCNVCARLFTLTNCTDVVHTPYMHNARVCLEKNETIVFKFYDQVLNKKKTLHMFLTDGVALD